MVRVKTSLKKKPYTWSEIRKAISPVVKNTRAVEAQKELERENMDYPPILLEDIDQPPKGYSRPNPVARNNTKGRKRPQKNAS